ncbi:MAG: aminotransferase class III-fold pyridoxal phosphate-dependent enzyme [Elusimicrobia bacterium]|nr:aminotransferase class III-fold pyridoxal phosphate-dependent enzyme [Elusimicrobiota bacterium]
MDDASDLGRRAARALFNQWAPPRAYRGGMPVMVAGRGARLTDERGRSYLDGLSGLWCAPLGCGRPELVERVRRQLETLSYAPLAWTAHRPGVELAERLLALAPPGLERVFFCSGGGEGVDAALKFARRYWHGQGRPRRSVILHRRRAFHGATYGAASVSGGAELREPYAPLLPDTLEVCAPGCCGCPDDAHKPDCAAACVRRVEEALLSAGPERVAALIAEPVGAAGPVRLPPPGYWPALQEMLRRHGVLLILDEVLTGVGRTGAWFAASHWDIRPDLMILGKGLSGGCAPLGAVLLSGRVARALEDAAVPGYTFGGHPAACAAALETLAILEREGLLANAAARGEELRARLREAAAPYPWAGPVSGLGLLCSLRLRLAPGQGSGLMEHLREQGLLCLVEDEALCLAPPLSVSAPEIREIAGIVAKGLAEIQGHKT